MINHFLYSNKILVFRAGIHKMLIRIANREDPDQRGSSLIWVCTVCLGLFGKQLELEHILTSSPDVCSPQSAQTEDFTIYYSKGLDKQNFSVNNCKYFLTHQF